MKKRIFAILMAILMLIPFTACGDKEDGAALIEVGDHQALYNGAWLTKDYDGDDAIVIPFTYTNNSDETTSFMWALFYTVKQGGADLANSTIFVSADSFDTLSDDIFTDVAPGASLDVALTYKLNNLTDPVEMEFTNLMGKKKGELKIDVTALEVKDAPDAQTSEIPDDSEPENTGTPADGPAAYKLLSFTSEGAEISGDTIEMMGGGWVVFNGDGTGAISMFGETFPITYDESNLIGGDQTMPYTLADGTLEFTMEDGTVYTLEYSEEMPDLTIPEGGTEPESEPESGGFDPVKGYPFESDIVENYQGDWHGMARFYDCTGDYSDNNDMECEIVARFVFDEEGYCAPYIRLCLSQSEDKNVFVGTMNYDAEYNCMLFNGTLMDMPLTEIDSFVEINGEVIYIGITCTDGENTINTLGCLRRLDDEWDYENDDPALPADGVKFYAGMSMEEIVELYGYDVSLLPELNTASTDSGDTEEGGEEAGSTDTPTLQQLIDWKIWLDEVNSYENKYYTPTFEECVEAMDGIAPAEYKKEKWTDETIIYKWATADGKDHIIITLKPTEDGKGWRYHSISWSSGVNG